MWNFPFTNENNNTSVVKSMKKRPMKVNFVRETTSCYTMIQADQLKCGAFVLIMMIIKILCGESLWRRASHSHYKWTQVCVIIVCRGVPSVINSVVKAVVLRMSRNSRDPNHKTLFLWCYCFFIKMLTKWKPLVFCLRMMQCLSGKQLLPQQYEETTTSANIIRPPLEPSWGPLILWVTSPLVMTYKLCSKTPLHHVQKLTYSAVQIHLKCIEMRPVIQV